MASEPSPSEWDGKEFPKVPDDLVEGKSLTSAQWNLLSQGLNRRIMSGHGDVLWRTGWYFHTLFSDIASNTLQSRYSFPRSDEFWNFWCQVPDDSDSFIQDGSSGRAANPWCGILIFRDGFHGRNDPTNGTVRGEQARFGGMAVTASTAKERWDSMKTRRGTITDQHAKERAQGCRVVEVEGEKFAIRVKDVDLYGLPDDSITKNAREILQVPRFISDFFQRLKSFGGRIVATSQGSIHCDGQDYDVKLPDDEIENTPPPGNEGEDGDYPGVPRPPPEPTPGSPDDTPPTFPSNPDDIVQGAWTGDYLAPDDGDPNAPAWDYFIHEKGGQFEQIMMHFCSAFRGLHPISDKSNYEIQKSAFNFHRFFTSQYLHAPTRNHANYPALTASWLQAGANSAIAGTEDRFTLGGVMISHDGNSEIPEDQPVNVTVELDYGNGVFERTTLSVSESGGSSAKYFASGGVRRIRAVQALPSGITGEALELFRMRPKIWDAYAVLRILQTIPDIGNNNDKVYSDDYFEHGTLFGPGTIDDVPPDPDTAKPLNEFAPYRIIKDFVNDLFRIFNYDRIRGYEVEVDDDGEEHSVLYFSTDAVISGFGGSQLNMFAGMIHERLSIAPIRGLSEEWAFQIGGRCSANDSDPAGQRIFKEDAYPQIRGAFCNPSYLFSRCMSKPYRANGELRGLTQYTRARRQNFGYLLRGLPTDGLGTGRFMVFPECPSGLNFRYGEDPANLFPVLPTETHEEAASPSRNTDDVRGFFAGAGMFPAPYLVDEISLLSDEDMQDKFPNGAISGVGAGSHISGVSRGRVVKVALKHRLRATEEGAARAVSNTGQSWTDYSKADRWDRERSVAESNGHTFAGIRSDENMVIELLIHRWQVSADIPSPPRRLGDFSASASVDPNAMPHTMWGSVFCRFFFMKLIPYAHKDMNDVVQETDTRIYSHLFRKAETVIRASIGAYIDLDSINQNHQLFLGNRPIDPATETIRYNDMPSLTCQYFTPPRDLTMQVGVSKYSLDGMRTAERLAIASLGDEISRIDGYGPTPNIDFTSGMFIEFAKLINRMVGCAIPGELAVAYHTVTRIKPGAGCPDINEGLDYPASKPGCTLVTAEWIGLRWKTTDEVTDETVQVYDKGHVASTAGNTSRDDLPFHGPRTVNSPGYPPIEYEHPNLTFDEYGIVIGWRLGGGGFAYRSWDLNVYPPSARRIAAARVLQLGGSHNNLRWRVTGSISFLSAFYPLLRAFVTRTSFGKLTMSISGRLLDTGQHANRERQTGASSQFRYYGRPNDPNEQVNPPSCQVLTGGDLSAPGLPDKCSVAGTRYIIVGASGGRQDAGVLGGHASAAHHNVTESPDAAIIISTKGIDDNPFCEPVYQIFPKAWYQVVKTGDEEVDGAGIKYGLLPREGDPDERPVYLPGELFTAKEYPSSDAGRRFENSFSQADPSKHSVVCKRNDLPPPPERFYTP